VRPTNFILVKLLFMAGACIYFSLHAGLLRGVAYAPGHCSQYLSHVKKRCRTPMFQITTTPSDKQKRVLELIGQIKM
jgi:hypothetical protein